MTTRRDFLVGSGLAALALKLGRRKMAQTKMRLGYAAITWGDDYLRAIHEIAEVGYQGIQLRANVLPRFQQRPAELKDLLARRGLTFVALSSGNLNLDPVAHYQQGGGDPAAAIRRYRGRLAMLHLKDVETRREAGKESYRFVELGKGRVHLPQVFAALREINFDGWAIVELDAVPDGARTAKESAVMSKRYLERLLS